MMIVWLSTFIYYTCSYIVDVIFFYWLADQQRKLVGPCYTLVNARLFATIKEALPGERSQ